MNDDYRNIRHDRQRGEDDDNTLDRNFFNKAESLAAMERYLKELLNEAQGVREAIADLKDEIAGDAAADEKVAAAQAAPKRRGRPPKAVAETAAVHAAPKAVEKPTKAPAPEVTSKRRGRPPKAAAPAMAKSPAKPAKMSVPKKKPSRRKVAAKKVARKPVAAKPATETTA